jgi:hypothetical protein
MISMVWKWDTVVYLASTTSRESDSTYSAQPNCNRMDGGDSELLWFFTGRDTDFVVRFDIKIPTRRGCVFAACFRPPTNECQELSLPNPTASPTAGESFAAKENYLSGSDILEDGESVNPNMMQKTAEDGEFEIHKSIFIDDDAMIVVLDDNDGFVLKPSKGESEYEERIYGDRATVDRFMNHFGCWFPNCVV